MPIGLVEIDSDSVVCRIVNSSTVRSRVCIRSLMHSAMLLA